MRLTAIGLRMAPAALTAALGVVLLTGGADAKTCKDKYVSALGAPEITPSGAVSSAIGVWFLKVGQLYGADWGDWNQSVHAGAAICPKNAAGKYVCSAVAKPCKP